MNAQTWIFTVRYWTPQSGRAPAVDRWAVVGAACSSTVEAALHLAKVPEEIRTEIRSHAVVRDFVEGKLDRDRTGYYVQNDADRRDPRFGGRSSWLVCIGPVHEVLP